LRCDQKNRPAGRLEGNALFEYEWQSVQKHLKTFGFIVLHTFFRHGRSYLLSDLYLL
jgi:hypothetical protein